jgi:hypothetical protein
MWAFSRQLWKRFVKLSEDIYILSSFIFFFSLAIGIGFYMIINNWSFSLSYYFAASVLLGDMYLVPVEPNPYSPIFTLCYFVWERLC